MNSWSLLCTEHLIDCWAWQQQYISDGSTSRVVASLGQQGETFCDMYGGTFWFDPLFRHVRFQLVSLNCLYLFCHMYSSSQICITLFWHMYGRNSSQKMLLHTTVLDSYLAPLFELFKLGSDKNQNKHGGKTLFGTFRQHS